MPQAVVQSGANNFGGTSATSAVTLTNVQAGNRIEVRVIAWGFNTQPDCTVADGTNTYSVAARAQHTTLNDRHNAEIHYTINASTASRTVTVTHPSNSGNRFGHIWVGEISGGETTSPVAASGISAVNASGTTPSVTASGATGQATLVCGVLAASNGAAAGIDAASGSSLTWTNRLIEQDATAEMSGSCDDAPSATSITPTVGWGTLSTSSGWAACIAAFKDAAAGGTTTNKTMTDTLSAADEPVRWARRLRRQDEGISLLDSVVKTLSTSQIITRVMTELISLAEAVVRWNRRDRQQSDALIMFDDPNRVIEMTVFDQSLDVSDEGIDRSIRVRQQTDAVSMADGFVQWRRYKRSSDDTLELLDQFIKTVTGAGTLYTKVMSEAIEFSDGVVRLLRYRRQSDDVVDVFDGFSKLIAGAGITYARVMGDSVQMIDDTGNRWTFRRNLSTDALQLPDELVQGAVRGRVLNDALTFTDALTQWVRLVRLFGDDVEFSDGTVKVRQMLRTAEDEIDISDELIRSLFLDQLQPTDFRVGIGADPFVFGMGRSLLN
jgi:hypothetical protein